MHQKSPKFLEDIRAASAYVLDATRDQTEADYLDNETLRFAVERNFEIIGEALNRLAKINAETVRRIPDYTQIVAFRNVLIHGYDMVNHSRVWNILQNDLLVLHERVVALLQEADLSS